MTGSWLDRSVDWHRHRRRPQIPEADGPSTDIELVAPSRNPNRIDSDISISGLTLVNEESTAESIPNARYEEPIYLKLNFGDRIYTKLLEYDTFSRWSAMQELKTSLERDGVSIKDLRDEVERMEICSGDWDARVRPGWSLLLNCHNVEAFLEKDILGYDSDSEDTGVDEERWIDEVLDHYQEEWCLPRWRNRVEQETSTKKNTEDPSWRVLALGCISMIFFIVAVIVYTA